MIKHAKKLFFFSAAILLLIVFFSLFLYLRGRPTVRLADRDALVIYRGALSNRLSSDYLDSGETINRSHYIRQIQTNLSRNVVLSPSLTYKKIHYQRQIVLHNLAQRLYSLQFTRRTGRINRIILQNAHTAHVRYHISVIDLGRVLDHMSSSSEMDLSRAQKDAPANLSQSQTALLQYILIVQNWHNYLRAYRGQQHNRRSSFTMVFDPRNRRFLISQETLQAIQSSGVSNE